jgi:hypothetical protein
MIILLTDLIGESIIKHSIRAPECKVCHSTAYIQIYFGFKDLKVHSEKYFIKSFGWSGMGISNLIFFKKLFNEMK